jgi:hypothetical protein
MGVVLGDDVIRRQWEKCDPREKPDIAREKFSGG